MSVLFASLIREWRQAVNGMTFWIANALMVGVLMALVFFVSHFFDAGRADMVLVFGWYPFVAALFLPVIGAGLLARERQLGTDQLLPTGKKTVWPLMIGKWSALRLQGAVGLLLLIPFWIMVSWLGHPDMGMIVAAFLGAALLMTTFAALVLLAGTLRASVSLTALIGILLCLMVLLPLPVAVRAILPAGLQDALAGFSAQSHFQPFVRGLVRLSDVLYFASLTWAALNLAVRLHGGRALPNAPVIFSIILFLLINLGLAQYTSRFALDLTQDRQFSISREMRVSVRASPQPRHWTLYYSAAQAAKYPNWREYGQTVRLRLARLADASHGKLTVDEILLLPDTRTEDAALAAGMKSQPTDTGDPMVFGLAEQGKPVIALFNPAKAKELDLDLALALARPPGKTQALGLMDGADLAGKDWYLTGHKESISHMALRQKFQLQEGAKAETAPLLLINHPDANGDAVLARRLADDRPLAALVLVDPWRESASRTALNGEIRPGAHPVSQFPPALQKLGVRMAQGVVVFDEQLAATSGNPQTGQPEKWPLWLQIPAARYRPPNLLQSTLSRPLGLATAGSLMAHATTGWHWQPLLQTDDQAKEVSQNLLAEAPALARLRTFAEHEGAKTLMGLLSNSRQNKFIAVMADTDWLEDEYIGVHDPVRGWRPLRSNVEFLTATLKLLAQAPELMTQPPHGFAVRRLDRVEAWRSTAQAGLDQAEAKLAKAHASQPADNRRIRELEDQARSVRRAFATRMRLSEWGLMFPVLVLLPLGFALIGFWRNGRR